MAVLVPTCYTLHYKESFCSTQKFLGSNKISCICECAAISKNPKFSAVSFSGRTKCRTKCRRGLNAAKEESWNEVKVGSRQNEDEVFLIKLASNFGSHLRCSLKSDSQNQKLCNVWFAESNNKQLRSLGSYFGRLRGHERKRPLDSLKVTEEVIDTGLFTAKKELELLDSYFEKVDKDTAVDNYTLSALDEQHKSNLVFTSSSFEVSEGGEEKAPIRHKKLSSMIHRSIPKTTQLQEDEVSDLYLISVMISINIAVFLFEMASPVKNSDMELSSLPSLYGAKINHLILVGEWWRLVTPMFLVQDQ